MSENTVNKLLIDAGKACEKYHDGNARDVKASSIQCDDIWSFTYAEAKNVAAAKAALEGAGDTRTWTAIDRESTLIVSDMIGGRDGKYAIGSVDNFWARLANRASASPQRSAASPRSARSADVRRR